MSCSLHAKIHVRQTQISHFTPAMMEYVIVLDSCWIICPISCIMWSKMDVKHLKVRFVGHKLDFIALKETSFILWFNPMNLLAAKPTCDAWCGMLALDVNNECHSYCSHTWQWVYSSIQEEIHQYSFWVQQKIWNNYNSWRSKASSLAPLMAVRY